MHSSTAALPASPALAPGDEAEPMDMLTPPEIMAEVLIERMAVLHVRMRDLAMNASSAEERQAFEDARWAIRELRFAFDPHDRRSVHEMDLRMDGYSAEISAGRAPIVSTVR